MAVSVQLIVLEVGVGVALEGAGVHALLQMVTIACPRLSHRALVRRYNTCDFHAMGGEGTPPLLILHFRTRRRFVAHFDDGAAVVAGRWCGVLCVEVSFALTLLW